jgi:hypothetical protein
MNDSNFLKEIGRSYIVSAFLPAAIFLLLAYFLFRGFVPAVLLTQMADNTLFQNYQWIILFLMTLWLAFYLFSANDVTVRIFEGYVLPRPLYKMLVERKKKKVKVLLAKIKEWEEMDLELQMKKKKRRVILEEEVLRSTQMMMNLQTEMANFGIKHPFNLESVMPTRLGNILRSSEMYAYERYRIEEITIWPRLFNVLPVEFIRTLEEKHNHFMFLINSAFLVSANALISLIIALIGIPILMAPDLLKTNFPWSVGFFYIGYDYISPSGYFLISLVLGGFAYVLYSIAVNVAEDFSMYIRASFDLYRTNLLRQMNWMPPKTIAAEQDLWEDFSRFLIASERLGKINLPEFQYSDQDAQPKP